MRLLLGARRILAARPFTVAAASLGTALARKWPFAKADEGGASVRVLVLDLLLRDLRQPLHDRPVEGALQDFPETKAGEPCLATRDGRPEEAVDQHADEP